MVRFALALAVVITTVSVCLLPPLGAQAPGALLLLREVVAGSQPTDGEAVASLARDGLVRLEGELVSLPD